MAGRCALVFDRSSCYFNLVYQGFKKNILIPFIVTIAILLVLELVARSVLSSIYNRKFDSSLIQENKFGSSPGLKPNAYGVVWGKPFHTDEIGARKNSKKKSGKAKLLIIGDSVTEGVGVNDSSTFANIINDRSDLDVRNISLIGWSVDDYANAIDCVVVQNHDIKDIYLFYCLNDIYGSHKTKDLPSIGHRGILSRINGAMQDRYATYKLIKLYTYQHSAKYFQYDSALYHNKVLVQHTLNSLMHIKTLCDDRHIELRLFIMPYKSQFDNREAEFKNPSEPQLTLEKEFHSLHIHYLDLLPAMSHAAITTDTHPDDLYLYADEIHLSAKGHIIVANIIGSQ